MRILAVLVIALAVAGCSASPGAKQADDVLGDVQVETTATLGGIRGVVVDEAIRPVNGAFIERSDGGGNVTSSEEGTFAFDRLEPGQYFFTVSRPLFVPVQAQAVVTAGEVTSLRVQLLADRTPQPYHETFQKTGFIQYGAGIGTFAVNLVAQEFLDQSICNCYIRFDTAPGAVAIVIEATWESAVACPPGTTDDLYWQIYEGDTESIHIESAFTANPIYTVIDKVAAWDANQTSFEASVTEGGDCPRYNQQYESYYTAWYLAFPPEGWSIVAGTGVP
jgi:hypothetical protein